MKQIKLCLELTELAFFGSRKLKPTEIQKSKIF